MIIIPRDDFIIRLALSLWEPTNPSFEAAGEQLGTDWETNPLPAGSRFSELLFTSAGYDRILPWATVVAGGFNLPLTMRARIVAISN